MIFKQIKKIFSSGAPGTLLSIKYKGSEVFYSKDTSIVKRIEKTGEYEPEVVQAIVEQLGGKKNPVILDIGANIGLISISLLSARPDATVYAFEPGPHQNSLFKKTIEHNSLISVQLSEIALSNNAGKAVFRIHDTADASGDGFLDTKRAGKTRKIEVTTDTLDNWWIKNKKPAIDFIKMDTEGSEYWILEGGKALITELRPKMLIEINLMNIANYPFSLQELLQQIRSFAYTVCDLQGHPLSLNEMEHILKTTDTFLLLPETK